MDPIINLMACNQYIKIQNKTTEHKILVLPVEKIITVHKILFWVIFFHRYILGQMYWDCYHKV